MGEEHRLPLRGLRGILYRFFLWLARKLGGYYHGLPPSSIQTVSPANGQLNVSRNPTVAGNANPVGATVNGYVYANGTYTYANGTNNVTSTNSWTLQFSGLAANTQYTLKTFIVSTTDPASCVTSFTTGA